LHGKAVGDGAAYRVADTEPDQFVLLRQRGEGTDIRLD
jgi:hypothetical protein